MERDKGATPEDRRRRAEVCLKAWAWKKLTSDPEALLKLNRPLDWPVIEDDEGIDMRLGAAMIQLQRRMLQSDNPEAREAYAQALELVTRVDALREKVINSIDWEAYHKQLEQKEISFDVHEIFNTVVKAAEVALEKEANGKELGLFLCVFSDQGLSYSIPQPDLYPPIQVKFYRQLERWLHKMAPR